MKWQENIYDDDYYNDNDEIIMCEDNDDDDDEMWYLIQLTPVGSVVSAVEKYTFH